MTRRAPLALWAAWVGGAIALWCWWDGRSRTENAPTAVREGEKAGASVEASAADSPQVEPQREIAGSSESDELVCQVVVDGRASTSWVGTLRYGLRTRSHALSSEASAPIHGGFALLDVSNAVSVMVLRLEIDDREAFPCVVEHSIPKDRRLTLDASFEGCFVVPVVDADTGTPLTELQLFELPPEEPMPHPLRRGRRAYRSIQEAAPGSAARPPAWKGDSPIELRDVAPGSYVVGRPGYAWQRMDVRARRPSSGTIRLDRAADLRVVLEGAGWTEERVRLARLRWILREPLDSTDWAVPPAYSLSVGGSDTTLSRIATSVSAVDVVSAAPGCTPTRLASASIELRPGERTELRMTLDGSLLDVPATQLAGIVFPRDPRDRFELHAIQFTAVHVEALDALPEVLILRAANGGLREIDGVWHWSPIDLMPGEYDLRLQPMGLLRRIVVPEESPWLEQIEVAPFREQRLWVVDAETGEPVVISSCHAIHAETAAETARAGFDGFSRPDPPNPFLLRVPPGAVAASIAAEGYATGRFVFDVSDSATHTFALHREGRLQLQLTAFGSPVALESDWWHGLRIEAVPPDERLCTGIAVAGDGGFRGSSMAELTFSEAGRYQIQFPVPSGYSTEPGPMIVQATREAARCEVDLTSVFLR